MFINPVSNVTLVVILVWFLYEVTFDLFSVKSREHFTWPSPPFSATFGFPIVKLFPGASPLPPPNFPIHRHCTFLKNLDLPLSLQWGEKGILLILLAFHEFLSDLLHIHRVNRWGLEVFLGTQKFRILTHKWNIFIKTWISNFSKMAILGVWCRKLSLGKIGVMNIYYIIDSIQRLWASHYWQWIALVHVKWGFPNIYLHSHA